MNFSAASAPFSGASKLLAQLAYVSSTHVGVGIELQGPLELGLGLRKITQESHGVGQARHALPRP